MKLLAILDTKIFNDHLLFISYTKKYVLFILLQITEKQHGYYD